MSAGFAWPLAPGTNRIRRGLRNHTFGAAVRRNADGSPRAHQGWDFSAQVGTPFFAVDSGVVESVQERGSFGLVLLLKCDQPHPELGGPMWVLYAHLSRVDVAQGARVKRGQPLGLTGNSGNAYTLDDVDDHLHLEVRTPAPWPGLGITGRTSPIDLFGHCPLGEAA